MNYGKAFFEGFTQVAKLPINFATPFRMYHYSSHWTNFP